MGGFSCGVEGGLVVLDLGGRRRDLELTCDMAYALAEALDGRAALAELEPRQPPKGQSWGIKVESAYGRVFLRFDPPEGASVTRVPIPPEWARRLADSVRFKAQQAEHRIRLTFHHRSGGARKA